MKKIVMLLMAVVLTACGTTTVVETKKYAKIEDIMYSKSNNYKYTAIAWQYKPKVKKYVIHTDSLYSIGSWIEIK